MLKKKYKVSRWIFLGLSAVTNIFLVLYSTLPSKITRQWNDFFRNILVGLINTATEKEVKIIPMTELDFCLSNEESYKYNYIPGYEVNQIPLGSAKQAECSYSPLKATDKSIEYYTEQNDIVKLNPSNTTISIIGMKTGSATIYAKNRLSGLIDSIEVEVVDTVAPVSFSATVSSNNIHISEQETITFDIDGGNLGHNELINFRYYDIRKLTFSSSNEDVATVNNYGVINPLTVGEATITISNEFGFKKTIDVNVLSGEPHPEYSDLEITGPNVCYDNDMLKDQSSGVDHYQLSIKDGDIELTPEDFVWESSNELLVKVDTHGIMRGFRKSVTDDEYATITAISKLTGQSVAFDVTVKEQLPSKIYYYIVNGKNTSWNPETYTAFIGEDLILNIGYEPNISKKDVTFILSDESLIECINQGSSLYLKIKGIGNCSITVTSLIKPSLHFSIDFKILKAGAISNDDLEDVGYSVRKVVGHAALFAIAEVFTIVALYMFLYDKKWWMPIVFSLGIELTLSSISEFVQFLTPGRHGLFTDVMINFAGAVVGAAIVVGIFIICKHIKKKRLFKKEQKQENNNS